MYVHTCAQYIGVRVMIKGTIQQPCGSNFSAGEIVKISRVQRFSAQQSPSVGFQDFPTNV